MINLIKSFILDRKIVQINKVAQTYTTPLYVLSPLHRTKNCEMSYKMEDSWLN